MPADLPNYVGLGIRLPQRNRIVSNGLDLDFLLVAPYSSRSLRLVEHGPWALRIDEGGKAYIYLEAMVEIVS
jgi:hypothetical protein